MKLFRLQTLLPFGFFLLSAGYVAFALGLERTGMIGDVRGYDPGGRFMPVLAGAVMGVLSLWVLIREIRANTPAVPFAAPLWLTLANLAISAGYIVLFRHFGYMLSTCLVVFWLTVFNLRATGLVISWPGAFAWLAATIAYLAGGYTLIRFLIRAMYRYARSGGTALAREPVAHALAATIAMLIVFFVMGRLLRRLTRSEAMVKTVQSSIGTTFSIYIAFRLLFLVQLPTGLMNW